MDESLAHCSTLFFDLDGTLTDPKEGITRCLQYALEQLGRAFPPQAELVQYIGPPLRWTFPRLLTTDDPALIDAAVEHYRKRYADVGMFENELYPGIPELLKILRDEGFRLFVVTSKPTVYAERIVDHFGLTGYFEAVYGPHLDGRFDDKHELIAHILVERSVMPADAIMIGDRASDILAGRANGTRAIAVTYGFGSIEELATAQPDRICHNTLEIRDTLGGPFVRMPAGE
jgi:phosphoglycolate phosphatase